MFRQFLYLIIFISSSFLIASALVGRIHSTSGDVLIYSSTKANSIRKAIIGRGIYEGDRITTGENGISQIIYDNDHAFIRIEPNSKVKFSSAGYSDIIDLISGQLYCQKATNDKFLKIFTSIGQYNTQNSRFWLSSNLNKLDEILIHTGKVDLNNQYSLSDIQVNKGEAALSKTNGEVYVGSYKSIKLENLKKKTEIIENFIEPVILKKDIPKINISDLIPQYQSQSQILSKNIQSFRNYRFQFGSLSSGESYFQIIPYFHQFNFKVGISLPLVFVDNEFRKTDYDDIFDYFDKINYLDYFNENSRYEIHLGKIQNKTWGPGGLLYNYRNTQNYLNKVRTGVDFTKYFGHKFLNFNVFISSLRDFFEGGGGLLGFRTEMFLTDSFPLKIGVGLLADYNNYSEFSELQDFDTRSITATLFDLNYKLISGINNYVDIYFEYDEIYYNEDIIFTSPGKDIIQKPGASNWILGTEIKRGSLIGNISLILSSKTMNSQFFNSLYDLEKARYIAIPSDSIINVNSRLNDLNNYSLNNNIDEQDETLQQYLIPKDVYAVYSNRLNYYDTPGVRFSVKRFFGNYGYFKFGYDLKIEKRDSQYFTIYDSETLTDEERINFEYTPKKYHSLEINAVLGDKVINGISGLEFFYLQYNAPSFFSYSDVSTSAEMGFNISLRPMQFMRLIIENKMIHFDYNYDGVIDKANNLNFELKFSL
tara:strand:+ start:29351 stop:31471 length:2121 start_codon:yes stop_codon:yes gene_type:complete